MHDEPIAHLYTNKKMRVRVSTSNNKKFICTVRRDNTVQELAEAVLERYNSLISDPMHRYYKQGFTAVRVSNIRQRSFYLSRTDYVSDLLNDDDEVECDVMEVGKKRLKKAIKQEKYSRILPEVREEEGGGEEGEGYGEANKQITGANKKRKKSSKKKRTGKEESRGKESEEVVREPEIMKLVKNEEKIIKQENMLTVPLLKIGQQTSISPLPSPKPSPKPSPLKQQVRDQHFKLTSSSKSIQQTYHPQKVKTQNHSEPKLKITPQNSQHMKTSQKSVGSLEQNHPKTKPQDAGSFKYPPKTDRSNPKTPEVPPLRSPSIKPTTFKKNQMESLNLDSKKPEFVVSGEKYPNSRKESQVLVVESDQQQQKPPQKPVLPFHKKQKKQLFKTSSTKPPDHSHIFDSLQMQQDQNSD